MDKTLIDDMELCHKGIKEARIKIAEVRFRINAKKSSLWEEATGTVDAKKDYIKFKIADDLKEIELLEADIEWYNNHIDLLTWKLMDNE